MELIEKFRLLCIILLDVFPFADWTLFWIQYWISFFVYVCSFLFDSIIILEGRYTIINFKLFLYAEILLLG